MDSAPADWPSTSEQDRPDELALLMFAHPRCGCTRASLRELERLLATTEIADVRILFFVPDGAKDDWQNSVLWSEADRIRPGAARADVGGREARRFGARTSGETLIYDSGGRLRFQGGLTAARAHEGNNPGAEAIRSIAGGSGIAPSSTRVFGCSLLDRDALQPPQSAIAVREVAP
ncbi:MAG: hypothetical protein KF774_05105 [Planctomyces sp.]|nr:hypothetical protein [Planctomyces sp.]